MHAGEQGRSAVTVIDASGRLIFLPWREVPACWELILGFVRREFAIRFKQTLLGPVWFVLQALLTSVVFTVVFGWFARISTEGVPSLLFYLGGVTLWLLFAESVVAVSNTFQQNLSMFSRVYFPRIAVVVAGAVSALIRDVPRVVFLFLVWLYFVVRGEVEVVWWGLVVLPVPIVIMLGMGVGVGLLIACLSAYYRDLLKVVQFVVSLLMFLSPVIYPVSFLPSHLQGIVLLVNPMATALELWRWLLMGVGTVSVAGILWAVVVCILLVFVGGELFARVERTVVDYA